MRRQGAVQVHSAAGEASRWARTVPMSPRARTAQPPATAIERASRVPRSRGRARRARRPLAPRRQMHAPTAPEQGRRIGRACSAGRRSGRGVSRRGSAGGQRVRRPRSTVQGAGQGHGGFANICRGWKPPTRAPPSGGPARGAASPRAVDGGAPAGQRDAAADLGDRDRRAR